MYTKQQNYSNFLLVLPLSNIMFNMVKLIIESIREHLDMSDFLRLNCPLVLAPTQAADP